MDSKDVLPLQQLGGEGKQKNGQAEARNRPVLRDIGNLAPVPALEGKPHTKISRPITRNFRAQLLANAQAAAAEKIIKKPVPEVINGGASTKADQKKPKTVVIISPDEEVKSKEENNSIITGYINGGAATKADPKTVVIISPDEQVKSKEENKSRIGSSSKKKTAKALTSILTARSKAACGLANKPKNPIANIDESDVDNELAVVEYVEDIYKFYKLTEDEGRVHDYMDSQPDINLKMRAILVDWLIEVHRKFELLPESLYLTINIMDRYLSRKTVSRRELQMVGIGSMLIACKYEEIWAPEVNDFIAISDNAYVREHVLRMEKSILDNLEWYLTVPTPYVFLVRYIKASVPYDEKMENMVFFLAELGLMHYSTAIMYCPSMLAASAVYAARCTLNKSPFWTETLKHYTGYSEDQLRECAKLLISFHTAAAESKLKAVYKKFSHPDKGAIALFPPATESHVVAVV